MFWRRIGEAMRVLRTILDSGLLEAICCLMLFFTHERKRSWELCYWRSCIDTFGRPSTACAVVAGVLPIALGVFLVVHNVLRLVMPLLPFAFDYNMGYRSRSCASSQLFASRIQLSGTGYQLVNSPDAR